MPSFTMYGIKNCDTIKKARTWLSDHGVEHALHDYRVDGLDKARLESWVEAVGWEVLLNKSSTTFRELSEADRANLDRRKAIKLMLTHPTMIKRPVLDTGKDLLVGFKPSAYEAALGNSR